MPTDDTLRTLRALIPDAAVAQNVPLSELRNRWIDMSEVFLRDPDAPMPPINLTARETYVQAESGIGLLKLYNSSRVDPLARHRSWVDPLADQYYGLVEFGSYEWVDRSADNLPGYYKTVKAPHDDAAVGVLFLPAVPNPGARNEWPAHCDGGIHYIWPFKFGAELALVIVLAIAAHIPRKQNKAAKQHH